MCAYVYISGDLRVNVCVAECALSVLITHLFPGKLVGHIRPEVHDLELDRLPGAVRVELQVGGRPAVGEVDAHVLQESECEKTNAKQEINKIIHSTLLLCKPEINRDTHAHHTRE